MSSPKCINIELCQNFRLNIQVIAHEQLGLVEIGTDPIVDFFQLDGSVGIRYTVMKTEGGVCMGYVAMIGLLFAPLICLLCCGWFYVRYQNEHDDAKLAAKSRRICQGFLLAAAISAVIFGVLKLIFPIAA